MEMAWVVFLRGVNVGGHKAFQPSALAKEMADFDAVNVGAAGTFVIRGPVGQRALRAELLRRLQFEAEFMICPGRELADLAGRPPFLAEPSGKDVERFASVLAKRPRTLPDLPLSQPADDTWQVKIVAVTGRYALSLRRRLGQRMLYPNEVVEKALGVSATTRNWRTICAVNNILKGG
jgi:uncharacterized protein (DUF1697 family)